MKCMVVKMTPQRQITGFEAFFVRSILKGYNPKSFKIKFIILKTVKTEVGLMKKKIFFKIELFDIIFNQGFITTVFFY